MKKLSLWLLILIFLATGLTASAAVDGEYTATAPGHGGDVVATLVVEGGLVKRFSVKGSGETPGVGGICIEERNFDLAEMVGYPPQKLELDALSGATVTSKAIQQTVADVLAQAVKPPETPAPVEKPESLETLEEKESTDIPEIVEAPLRVANGGVTIHVDGHSLTQKMEVYVSFKEGDIRKIEIRENGETPSVLKTVEERFIPRIVENQSLAVDAITGATVTSEALRGAVAIAIDVMEGDSSDWYAPVKKNGDVVVLDGYDVIVVGLGGAGLSAYLAAAEEGAKVFGLDAAAKVGGNSIFATKLAKLGIWEEQTEKADLLQLLADEGEQTVSWLEGLGFPSDILVEDTTETWHALLDAAREAHPESSYMLELTAEELLFENDKIAGIRARYHDGSTYAIYGDTVILATGGFLGSADLKMEHLGGDLQTWGMRQNDGAALRMAEKASAAAYRLNAPALTQAAQLKNILHPDAMEDSWKALLTALAFQPDALVIGQNGERFLNEAKADIAHENAKGGGFYYAIYSQAQIDAYREGKMPRMQESMLAQGEITPDALANIDEILAIGAEYGNVHMAETAEDLAVYLGMPDLPVIMKKYSAEAENDAFGKSAELVCDLSEGPYYAIAGAGYYQATRGGLDVDATLRVLRQDGGAIKNLFAAGQDCIGVIHDTADGLSLRWAWTTGRLAGQNAARH